MTPLPPLPPTPIPPPVPVETHPNRAGGLKPPLQPRVPSRSHPNMPILLHDSGRSLKIMRFIFDPLTLRCCRRYACCRRGPETTTSCSWDRAQETYPRKVRGSARRKARKGACKKLLWVKQSCKYRNTPRKFHSRTFANISGRSR